MRKEGKAGLSVTFQSLSGIMERSHESELYWKLVALAFQSLSGIMERSHANPRVKGSFETEGFNPFQGLWNVLTKMALMMIEIKSVSIPFRDYGTFSLDRLPSTQQPQP